ncbi:MAG: WYL domain-containing transcriptional regulator [Eggerthellaceae bacterium]|nr:WYL domain-containing transcriptional regulator [Eggerthellaceae bacterium]
MANQPNSKLKLLYLLDILRERTDAERGLSTQEIIEALAERGIDAARKSVYRDIEVLREAGFDVEVRREPYAVYALRTREFDIDEMILLADAVQSCPFLTEEMTDALIAKIGALASAGQRDMLARRVDVPSRVKMQNESVFSNLDMIQYAMRIKRKVRFHYFKYGPRKEKVLQLGGRHYEYAPIRLVYDGGYYYLLTYSEKYGDWVNYRVDRMLDVEVTDEPWPRDRRYESYDPNVQQPWAFGVFNGEPVKVTLAVEPRAMSLVIDRLGVDVDTVVSRDGKVRVYARVVPSFDFYGWLFQASDVVELEAPKRVVREYRERLEAALARFGGE